DAAPHRGLSRRPRGGVGRASGRARTRAHEGARAGVAGNAGAGPHRAQGGLETRRDGAGAGRQDPGGARLREAGARAGRGGAVTGRAGREATTTTGPDSGLWDYKVALKRLAHQLLDPLVGGLLAIGLTADHLTALGFAL